MKGVEVDWSAMLNQTYELTKECLQTNYYGAKRMVDAFISFTSDCQCFILHGEAKGIRKHHLRIYVTLMKSSIKSCRSYKFGLNTAMLNRKQMILLEIGSNRVLDTHD